MTHSVLIPEAIAALNVDSYNRSAVCASNVDNGNIVALLTMSATAGESEVWTATVPATGSLSSLWMVYSGDEIVTTNAQYKGLDPDPRNFFNLAGKTFSVFKPQVGDIIVATVDNFATGTGIASAYANAIDTTGGLKLQWAASNPGSITSFRYIATDYISLPSVASIETQRVTVYRLECVAN